MSFTFTSKLPDTRESIFATMSGLANKTKSLNLSQGFPDFECDPALIELVNKYSKLGFNQYAPMPGVPALTLKIAEKTKYYYGVDIEPATQVSITSGATQAIYTAINAYVKESDEVIIFEPAYDSYYPAIKLNGGIPVPIKLDSNNGFSIPWDEVKKKINSKTAVLIINSPHNPSGYVIDDNDVKELLALAEKYNFLIISDEVYEHIIFDNLEHLSLLKYPEIRDRLVVISSFGKTFHTTGWKVGYVISTPELISEFRKVHQFTVFAVNTPVQHAYAEYMSNFDKIDKLPKFYQAKRDYFNSFLKDSPFNFAPAKGTYFQLLDFSPIFSGTDTEFAMWLIENAKVAVIPLSPFYSDNQSGKFVRVCFAKRDEILEQGAVSIVNSLIKCV